MSLAELIALVLFAAIVAYALFGGADFGTGFWDLTAGGDRRGAPTRALIDHSIGPVWEANHVWLIFVLVVLWTGFPEAFAAIMRTLYVPFCLAGLGVLARGTGFAFRKFADTLGRARLYGVIFATSSVMTPFFLGTVAGAIASGRVPLQGSGDRLSSWWSPSGVLGGVLAVATCAHPAAAYLVVDADRHGDDALVAGFRRRAVASGVGAGVVAVAGIPILHADAPTLFDGLTGRAAPLIAVSAAAGLTAIWLLHRHRLIAARAMSVVAVAAVVWGWGIAQYPDVLVDVVEIDEAAGADATLWGLVVTTVLALVLVVPSLAYLYVLTQRGALDQPGGRGE